MPLCATHPANSCLRICMQAQYLVSLLQWPLYRCRSAGTCALCVLTSKWGICHVLTYNLTRGGVLLGLKDVVTITPELTAAASVPLSSTCTTACMYHSTAHSAQHASQRCCATQHPCMQLQQCAPAPPGCRPPATLGPGDGFPLQHSWVQHSNRTSMALHAPCP